MSKECLIAVEVAYATPEKQMIIPLTVIEGCTVYDAFVQSNIMAEFPEIQLINLSLGIFGQLEIHPKEHILKEGDRVEIYRPLMVDPKESRKMRAEKMKREKEKNRREQKLQGKISKRVRTTDH